MNRVTAWIWTTGAVLWTVGIIIAPTAFDRAISVLNAGLFWTCAGLYFSLHRKRSCNKP